MLYKIVIDLKHDELLYNLPNLPNKLTYNEKKGQLKLKVAQPTEPNILTAKKGH